MSILVDSSKNLFKFVWSKTKKATGRFLSLLSFKPVKPEDFDKKLVYSLSPRKLPNREQIKHLPKFLQPREILILRVCAALIILSAAYLLVLFFRNNLYQYPLSGGTYIEAIVTYPKNLSPLYAKARDVDNDLSSLIYSSLFKYNQDGRLKPDLVADWSVSDDHQEYILTLKDGVRWHDGEPLRAEDVIFTIEAIQHPSFNSPLRSALSIISPELVDDLTVRLKLTEPYAPVLEILTFGIMPKHLWRNISPEGAILSDLNLKPVGSGPYRFKSLVKSANGDWREYNLEVNPDYYGSAPYINQLQFKFYADIDEAIRALNAKQVDGLSHLPFERRLEVTIRSSVHFYELAQPRVVALFFNQTQNTALANKDLRQALAGALNRRALVDDIFAGAYQLADSPIPPLSWAYRPDTDSEIQDEESITERLSAGPFKATLTLVDVGLNAAVAQAIKTDWESRGAEISLRSVSGEQVLDIVKNRDFEILLYGQSVGGDPDLYAFWHSSQRGASGLNLANYSNSDVDRLLLEARTDVDQESRFNKYREVQTIISQERPAIFLYSPTYTYVQSNKVRGFSGQAAITPANRLAGLENWYVKTRWSFRSDQ